GRHRECSGDLLPRVAAFHGAAELRPAASLALSSRDQPRHQRAPPPLACVTHAVRWAPVSGRAVRYASLGTDALLADNLAIRARPDRTRARTLQLMARTSSSQASASAHVRAECGLTT